MRLLNIFIILFINFLFFLIPAIPYCFSYPENNIESLVISAKTTNLGGVFALYDNRKRSYQKLKCPFISAYNPSFSSICRFDNDFFLTDAARLTVNPDTSISNQLFANLKFHQLYLEYEILNKKFNNVNSYGEVPSSNLQSIEANINKQDLFKKKQLLETEHKYLSKLYPGQLVLKNETVIQNTSINQTPLINNSNALRNSINGSSAPKNWKNAPKKIYGPEKVVSKITNKDSSSSSDDKKPVPSQIMSSQRERNQKADSQFIRFVLSITKYISENSIETAIYGLLLIFFLSIFTGRNR